MSASQRKIFTLFSQSHFTNKINTSKKEIYSRRYFILRTQLQELKTVHRRSLEVIKTGKFVPKLIFRNSKPFGLAFFLFNAIDF